MNILQLSDSISKIKGIGPRYLKYLEKLGIFTVKDLLWYFPFRYEDFSQIKKIKDLQENEKTSIIGKVIKSQIRKSFRRKIFITEIFIEDETGVISAIWFNQPYLIKNIPLKSTIAVSGKISKQGKKIILNSPSYEIISQQVVDDYFEPLKDLKHTAKIVPIYPLTEGLTSRALRFFIKPLLVLAKKIKEPLPEKIIRQHQLPKIQEALLEIHYPSSLLLAKKAQQRFIFQTLFFTQLHLLKFKKKLSEMEFPKISPSVSLMQKFVGSLPFTLTNAQRKIIWQIMQDLAARPMNRLIEGDVGSGKTVIAMAASLLTTKSDWQVVYLAPTEILAKQHFEKFKDFFKNEDIKIFLFTSNNAQIFDSGLEGKITKTSLLRSLASNSPFIVIGTHALIQKEVKFNKLGLVIIDEQHRFGIRQRQELIKNKKPLPHLLSMSATPIPRTLSLALFGDLDLSILNEMPKDRKKIITQIISSRLRQKTYDFVEQEILKGHQIFVICPRIETPEEQNYAPEILSFAEKLKFETKAVKKEYERLSKEVFPNYEIAMLHGKMKSKEKDLVMQKFINKEIDILVSTSVIEVGIDIPNATVMIIEGAELFGLAQLHQFRGRVGRGIHQSYCFLMTKSTGIGTTTRLKAMVNCDDGFKLAEKDLEIRGPGEFFGTKQAGMPDLAMASLSNLEMIEKANEEAKQILAEDLTLKKWPELLAHLIEFQKNLKN